MARDYMIYRRFGAGNGELQITGDDMPEEHHTLHAASDDGQLREAEQIINERFYDLEPFPGFHWQPTNPDGWRTTDHDLRSG